MKKERFKEIVHNYSSTSDEIISLKKLANEYPFSQIIHLLLANSSKSSNSNDYKPNLTTAAFYTTDRTILKSLIEHNLVPSETNQPIVATPKKVAKPQVSVDSKVKTEDIIVSETLAEDVLKNLEKLQIIKKEAAEWLDNWTSPTDQKKEESAKKTKPKQKKLKKVAKPNTQSKIIEKFIKEEPRITKNAKPLNEKEDMANKSGVMREDVISESLAKIFVKQGKNKKAIDIYKKLIWKFPQKKTLFAAEIEKLKKK